MTFKGPLEVGKTYELMNGDRHRCTHKDMHGFFIIQGISYYIDGTLLGQHGNHSLSVKRCIDDRPPIGVLIKWDGSETPPVPVGTEVTLWWPEEICPRQSDTCMVRRGSDWSDALSYLVHSYPAPRKVTLQECWVVYTSGGRLLRWTCETEDAAEKYKPNGGFIRHIPAEDRDAND